MSPTLFLRRFYGRQLMMIKLTVHAVGLQNHENTQFEMLLVTNTIILSSQCWQLAASDLRRLFW